MINLILLKELEACRDLNEVYEFLKSRGIDCTKADLLNLKNEYNNKFNNENTLTLKQLNSVAGGIVYHEEFKRTVPNETGKSMINGLGKDKYFWHTLGMKIPITKKEAIEKLDNGMLGRIKGKGEHKEFIVENVNPLRIFTNLKILSRLMPEKDRYSSNEGYQKLENVIKLESKDEVANFKLKAFYLPLFMVAFSVGMAGLVFGADKLEENENNKS